MGLDHYQRAPYKFEIGLLCPLTNLLVCLSRKRTGANVLYFSYVETGTFNRSQSVYYFLLPKIWNILLIECVICKTYRMFVCERDQSDNIHLITCIFGGICTVT